MDAERWLSVGGNGLKLVENPVENASEAAVEAASQPMAKTSELEDSDATGPGTAKLQMPTVDMSGQTAGTVEQENTDLTKLAGSLEPPVQVADRDVSKPRSSSRDVQRFDADAAKPADEHPNADPSKPEELLEAAELAGQTSDVDASELREPADLEQAVDADASETAELQASVGSAAQAPGTVEREVADSTKMSEVSDQAGTAQLEKIQAAELLEAAELAVKDDVHTGEDHKVVDSGDFPDSELTVGGDDVAAPAMQEGANVASQLIGAVEPEVTKPAEPPKTPKLAKQPSADVEQAAKPTAPPEEAAEETPKKKRRRKSKHKKKE